MRKAALLALVPAVMAIPAAAPGAAPTVYRRVAAPVAQPTEIADIQRRDIIDDVETYVALIIFPVPQLKLESLYLPQDVDEQ